MKNKKFTYFVLLPSVLFIWSLIVYKILDSKNADYTPTESFNKKQKSEDIIENEDYQLLNNYQDPFFSQQPYSDELFDAGDEVIVPQKKWPAIRFNGYIVNGTKVRCHMTINNEDKILQEKEKFAEDFIISKITPDSVKVSSESDSKWYKKVNN